MYGVAANGNIQLGAIFASGNWVEAETVVCALEGHEILALLVDDNACRILPQVVLLNGGVKVMVRLEDWSDAADVLRLAYTGDPPFVSGFLTVPWSLPASLVMWVRKRWRGSKDEASE